MSLITFVCYEESCGSMEENLALLCKEYTDLKYWYILHNNDIDSNHQPKKLHYHVILSLTFKDSNHQTKEKTRISELFGINIGLIQRCSNLVGSLIYFTHKLDASKYQYNVSDIITNDIDTLTKAYELNEKTKKDSSAELEELFKFIDNSGVISVIEVFNYVRQRKLFFKLQALGKTINWYINYHNQLYGSLEIDLKYKCKLCGLHYESVDNIYLVDENGCSTKKFTISDVEELYQKLFEMGLLYK